MSLHEQDYKREYERLIQMNKELKLYAIEKANELRSIDSSSMSDNIAYKSSAISLELLSDMIQTDTSLEFYRD